MSSKFVSKKKIVGKGLVFGGIILILISTLGCGEQNLLARFEKPYKLILSNSDGLKSHVDAQKIAMNKFWQNKRRFSGLSNEQHLEITTKTKEFKMELLYVGANSDNPDFSKALLNKVGMVAFGKFEDADFTDFVQKFEKALDKKAEITKRLNETEGPKAFFDFPAKKIEDMGVGRGEWLHLQILGDKWLCFELYQDPKKPSGLLIDKMNLLFK